MKLKSYIPSIVVVMQNKDDKDDVTLMNDDVYFSKSDIVKLLNEYGFINFGKKNINDLTIFQLSVIQVKSFLDKLGLNEQDKYREYCNECEIKSYNACLTCPYYTIIKG